MSVPPRIFIDGAHVVVRDGLYEVSAMSIEWDRHSHRGEREDREEKGS